MRINFDGRIMIKLVTGCSNLVRLRPFYDTRAENVKFMGFRKYSGQLADKVGRQNEKGKAV